jgi:pilus assembly protein Flp/PilA
VSERIEHNSSWNGEHSFYKQPSTKNETPIPKIKGEWKMKKLINFFKDEEGATMVEYGVLVALIAAVSIGVIKTLGVSVFDAFTKVDGAMP